MLDKSIMVWDATNSCAKTTTVPNESGRVPVSNNDGTFSWMQFSGGGAGVGFIGTRAQYEIAVQIPEGQDGYIPDKSLVIITNENPFIKGIDNLSGYTKVDTVLYKQYLPTVGSDYYSAVSEDSENIYTIPANPRALNISEIGVVTDSVTGYSRVAYGHNGTDEVIKFFADTATSSEIQNAFTGDEVYDFGADEVIKWKSYHVTYWYK